MTKSLICLKQIKDFFAPKGDGLDWIYIFSLLFGRRVTDNAPFQRDFPLITWILMSK